MRKTALVCGAAGFIGGHLVRRLVDEGFWVRGVDILEPQFRDSHANNFQLCDLRDPRAADAIFDQDFDEVYQLAADMGGAGYLFTGENDAAVMHNSATINLNILESFRKTQSGRIFYSSSACIYPERNQLDPNAPDCSEASAYPAAPDSEYGWEKLFSERLYAAYARNYGLTCRIGRYHNIYGPFGTWDGGKEKAPAAMCRKVAEAPEGGAIEVWGSGRQTRSFLFVDECLEGTIRLLRSDEPDPLNIGSEEMISVNGLAEMCIALSGKSLTIENVTGPVGVAGRRSDNREIRARLGWAPSGALCDGLATTYAWIADQVAQHDRATALADGG